MANLLLERFSHAETETEGLLFMPDAPLATMERPWLGSPEFPAGARSVSCVPVGRYALIPFERSNGHKTWALANESLGVFVGKSETYEIWHRFAILLHSGNTVDASEGCILPGVRRGWLKNKRAVMASGYRRDYAMDRITKALGEMASGHTLTIRNKEIWTA